jgi:hypothetical protein
MNIYILLIVHVFCLSGIVSEKSISSAELNLFEPSKGILFGAWLNTENQTDSPEKFNSRIKKKAAFFHFAEDFPVVFQQPFELVRNQNTDYILYTLFPTKFGYSEAEYRDLIEHVQQVTRITGKIFLRFGPEMNGIWKFYGQKPTQFLQLWRNVYSRIRGDSYLKDKVAFVWAPNFSQGYPYNFTNISNEDLEILDTNGNRRLDIGDDPYVPYYPGDEYVDWVGLSTYYFGSSFPWADNIIPPSNSWEQLVLASNFYSYFCQQKQKPFMVAESGAAFHLRFENNTLISSGDGEMNIKRAFWRQYLLNPEVQIRFPKLKAVCLFEYIKCIHY